MPTQSPSTTNLPSPLPRSPLMDRSAAPCACPPVTSWSASSCPPTWTAADLTFQFSADNVTYQNAYDAAGTELTVVGTAAANIPVDPLYFRCAPFLKVRSGTAGTAVAQAAARSIGLVSRPL